MGMMFREKSNSLAAPVASSLASRDAALCSFGHESRGFQRLRIRDDFSIARRREVVQAKVDTNSPARWGQRLRKHVDASKRHEPSPVVERDSHRLGCALQRAVLLEPNLPQKRNSHTFAASNK